MERHGPRDLVLGMRPNNESSAPDDSSERWLPVLGYEGLYEVSDRGSVRALERIDSLKRTWPAKVMALHTKEDGHLRVGLRHPGGKQRHHFVHKLVLEAFVGPRPSGMVTRHLNGDPADNSVENICWGTHVDNMADQRRLGEMPLGEGVGTSVLTEKDVIEIRSARAAGETFVSISKRLGVGENTVRYAALGLSWQHVPRVTP